MIPSASIASQVTAALTGLGSTPGEVAQILASKGIRGRCYEANACAIAVYLTQQFPEASWVGVTPSGAESQGYVLVEVAYTLHEVPLPQPIEGFACGFDDGHYPDLIAP